LRNHVAQLVDPLEPQVPEHAFYGVQAWRRLCSADEILRGIVK
jgi:hypothetical protein